MKSVILLAPPAGGKGTQSILIKEEYKIPHISTGDLLRGACNTNDDRAKLINDIQEKGLLVPDEIVLSLLKERLQQSDCNNGYILDGFPRNIEQANSYEKILKELKKDLGIVILLNMNKEIAKSRIVNRIICPKCGTVYNSIIEELMPNVAGKCNNCNGNLIHRNDDSAETYDKRYEVYLENTAPLIDYYKGKNILYEIDSTIGKENVFMQIKNILGSNK